MEFRKRGASFFKLGFRDPHDGSFVNRSKRIIGQDWAPYLKERLMPNEPVVMYQRWSELLFLHWKFNPELIQKTLPKELTVDTFEGSAWLGIVPFQMSGVRPRWLPPVSGLSSFPELNLRTYVRDGLGRPGVWFYSLDTSQPIANWIARTLFHLNYRRARFDLKPRNEGIRYVSTLKLETGWDEPQLYDWTRTGSAHVAETGSIDFFLVERYRLFAHKKSCDTILTGRVYHEPYPLHKVELERYSTHLFETNGFDAPARAPDHAIASAGVDVQIFPMRKVGE